MDIIELYKHILSDAGLTVDADGMASIDNSRFGVTGDKTPVLIEGKRLVLPTYKQLAENSNDKIFFHPLHENLLRGESQVITKLRGLFSTRLSFTIGILVQHMLDICASVNKHRYLNPDQSEVLSVAPNCDEQTCKNFASILYKCVENDAGVIHFYLKRAGVVKGVKYARAGIVSFPLFEEIQKNTGEVYGVKLRKKDYESIIGVFKYILKNIDTPEAYNRGSDSDMAPFMDALMKTFLAISSELNDIIIRYKGFDEDANLDALEFNAEWQDAFKDLSVMSRAIKLIPPQPGNEGESRKVELNVSQTAAAPLEYVPGTNNVPQQPQPMQQREVKSPTAAVPFDQLMRQQHQTQMNTMPYPVQPQQWQPQPQVFNQFPGGQPGFQQPRQLSPLDVINAGIQMNGGFMQPNMGGFNQPQQWQPGMPRSTASYPQPNQFGNPMGGRPSF